MRQLSLTVISLLLIHLAYAQKVNTPKTLVYKAIVTTMEKGPSLKGNLTSISDSSIFISSTKYSSKSARQVTIIDYSDINTVTLRRRGSTGKGIMIGSLVGLVTGVVVGVASYEKPKDDAGQFVDDLFKINKTTMGVVGGILGVLSGGVVGGVTGALLKKKFIIGGNKAKFETMKLKVLP